MQRQMRKPALTHRLQVPVGDNEVIKFFDGHGSAKIGDFFVTYLVNVTPKLPACGMIINA